MDFVLLRLRNCFLITILLLECDGGAEAMLPSGLLLSHELSNPIPVEDPPSSWTEDKDWWEGAEEIDLTLPFDELTAEEVEDYLLLQDENSFFNESYLFDLHCDDFVSLPSPPVMEDVPPPPLPPFLLGMGEILQESFQRWHKRNTVDFQMPKSDNDLFTRKLDWVTFDDNKCSICDWANGGNETIELLSRKQVDPNLKMSNMMVIILVVVALVSALIGATVMGVLLKCKKVKSLPCGTGRNWLWSSNRRVHTQSSAIPKRNNKNVTTSTGTGILPGFAMKLWRRGSSQSPLNPCSSPGSENSYSEEPYINADASSATYAELNSGGIIPGGPVVRLDPSPLSSLPYNNTYCEIPSPIHAVDICSRMCRHHHEGTYENSGYMLSETLSDPNESSTGSNSTPSSAYYSDVSSSDVYTNKKKKKKRKGTDDRPSLVPSTSPIIGGSLSPLRGVPVICSHVTHQPVHLNLNAVQSQYMPSRDNNAPVTLQLLPRQIEKRISENSTVLSHQAGMMVHNKNLSQSNIVHQNPRLLLNVRNHNLSKPPCLIPLQSQVPTRLCSNPNACQNASLSNHCCKIQESQEELLLRQYNGNVVQRPLPPLPSRQAVDSRRRQLKVCMGTDVQNIPMDV